MVSGQLGPKVINLGFLSGFKHVSLVAQYSVRSTLQYGAHYSTVLMCPTDLVPSQHVRNYTTVHADCAHLDRIPGLMRRSANLYSLCNYRSLHRQHQGRHGFRQVLWS